MKVFNARHFLRHVSMPTLRQFTDGHILGARLLVDWTQPAETLRHRVALGPSAMLLAHTSSSKLAMSWRWACQSTIRRFR